MSGKETLNGSGPRIRPDLMAKNVTGFAHDVANLMELHVRLFKHDAQQSVRRLMVPAWLALAGVIVLLGAVPILLLGIAQALQSWTDVPDYLCVLISFIVGLAVSAVLLRVSFMKFQASSFGFQRSITELTRNWQYLKATLSRHRSHES